MLVVLHLAAALAVAPPVPAEPAQSVVVVPAISFDGELPPQWRHSLRAALLDGLRRGQFSVEDAPDCAAPCSDRTAEFRIESKVRAGDRSYDLRVELVESTSGETIAEASATCDVCGLEEVEERISTLAAGLRDRVVARQSGPPVLVVATDPPGAAVFVDDKPVGTTPLELDSTRGTHRIRVEKDGFVTERRSLDLFPGVREHVTIGLDAVPAAPIVDSAPAPDPTRKMEVPGWVMVGVGASAVVAGAVLWGIDSRPVAGRCNGDAVDAQGDCRFLYDTRVGGISLLASGAVVTVVGAVLVGVARRRRASEKRDVAARGARW